MKSIKPGRGPSFMGGVMSILVGLFGQSSQQAWAAVCLRCGYGYVYGSRASRRLYRYRRQSKERCSL